MSLDELLMETNGLLEESYPDFKKAAEEKRRKCKESMEAMSKLMKGIFNHSVLKKIAKSVVNNLLIHYFKQRSIDLSYK